MKKQKLIFTGFLFVLVFCFFSCDLDRYLTPQNTRETVIDYAPLLAIYQMEVVNNTGSTVKVFDSASFSKSEKYGVYLGGTGEHHIVVGNTVEKIWFRWWPRPRMPYPGCINENTHWPTVKEMKKQFYPQVKSFFLRIQIDDNEYYLAGWPQSIELPSVIDNGYGFVFDTSKIVQYGIGYGDCKEVRVANDWVYVPCIISIDNEDQTKKYDFDDAETVYAKAVLTIDGPGKISFKTIGLALSPEEL